MSLKTQNNMKKSSYRVVPTTHEKFGACWEVKQGKSSFGIFISKVKADKKKLDLESLEQEKFLIAETTNQELKLDI
jgi:hypothetical protein